MFLKAVILKILLILIKKREERSLQNRVRKSAHKNILKAALTFITSLGLGVLISKKGANSKMLAECIRSNSCTGFKVLW